MDSFCCSNNNSSMRSLSGMTVLISGASGMVGSRLVKRLRELECNVIPLTTAKNPPLGSVRWDPENHPEGFLTPLPDEGKHIDAVIHLGGHPVQPMWTESLKRKVYDSRVNGAKILTKWLESTASEVNKKRVLITASGVGCYEVKPANYTGPALTEKDTLTGPYRGLLDHVARDSESACDGIRDKVRVCHARFGIILDREGGVLKKLMLPYKMCVGGPMGSGTQAFPWVSWEDTVEALIFMLQNETLEGPFNVVSPGAEDTSQKRFSDALAKALRRPAFIPTPGFIISAVMGKQAADAMLLGSVKVRPEALLNAGFQFKDVKIEECLEKLLK